MTNYISRTGGQKKRNILRQKELALKGEIRREASHEKLQKSAEKVRSAQLGLLKALIYEAEPSRSEDEDRSKERLLKLAEENDYWKSISVHEIIQSYSEKADETSVVDRKKWWDFRPR